MNNKTNNYCGVLMFETKYKAEMEEEYYYATMEVLEYYNFPINKIKNAILGFSRLGHMFLGRGK